MWFDATITAFNRLFVFHMRFKLEWWSQYSQSLAHAPFFVFDIDFPECNDDRLPNAVIRDKRICVRVCDGKHTSYTKSLNNFHENGGERKSVTCGNNVIENQFVA